MTPYAMAPEQHEWTVGLAGQARFTWEYDDGRDRLLALYQKGKEKQWDSVKRIDWDLEVDPFNALGLPDEFIPVYGSDFWHKLSPDNIREIKRHTAAAQISQFLHGEQGALITAARIIESVPDLDSKFYAATQVMDEARHVEVFGRFLHEKIGLAYPIHPGLQELLGNTLDDSRWDMPYLGMQVLIEGLALAAFGVLRDFTGNPLAKQILAYVMQDEARHVAFGRMALRDYYSQLSESELREREDFVIEGCYLMHDRFTRTVLWENLGLDTQEAERAANTSPGARLFRKLLFSRIVPCVRDIGLWSDRLIQAYDDLGVLKAADGNLDELMRQDEEVAEQLDTARFAAEEAGRAAEVDETIAAATE